MTNLRALFFFLKKKINIYYLDGGIQQIIALGRPRSNEEKEGEKLPVITKEHSEIIGSNDDESLAPSTEDYNTIVTTSRRKRYRASADKAAQAIQETMEIKTRVKRRQISTE